MLSAWPASWPLMYTVARVSSPWQYRVTCSRARKAALSWKLRV